jgi:hypothetical protein
MNATLRDKVKTRLDADPLVSEMGVDTNAVSAWDIRLLCTRGHFITNVAVVEIRADLVLLSPLDKDGQLDAEEPLSDLIQLGMSRPPRASKDEIRHKDNRIGVYGRGELKLACSRTKCSYSGSFEYFGLAREIRSAAAAGKSEYRLTD